MSGKEVLKLGVVSISMVATGLGGYLYLTREEPAVAAPSVCPITGARSHEPAPEVAGQKHESSPDDAHKAPAL